MTNYVKKIVKVCTVSVVSLMAVHAVAQGSIDLKMNSFKEIMVADEDGNLQPKLVIIDTAIPGDTIVYVTEYKNISQKTVDSGATIISLVPENTTFIDNSLDCNNCTVQFSTNNRSDLSKAIFKPADELIVVASDGSTRTATATDFTLLQWRLNDAIEPAASGDVSFKVKIKRSTSNN